MYLLILLLGTVAAIVLQNNYHRRRQSNLRAHMLHCCQDVRENMRLVEQCLIPEQYPVEMALLSLAKQRLHEAALELQADILDRRQLEILISHADLLVHDARQHALNANLEKQARQAIANAEKFAASGQLFGNVDLATARQSLAEGDFRSALWHAEQAGRAGARHFAQASINSLARYLRRKKTEG